MAEQKIDELKISEEEANAVRISNSADRPNAFNSYRESKKTAADVKKMFDAPFELLRGKHDKTVDELRKYNAAESEREAAETEREEAETERANAEQERKTAEKARDEKIDEIYEAYKSGQLKGDKGDKGDPGSVNVVDGPGDSEKDAMSQKATTEYVKEYIPKVATKNLLAVTWENAQLNIFDGAYIKHDTGMQFVASPDYIEVVGGDTYTLSWIEKTTSTDVRVFEYSADKTFIKSNYTVSASRLLTFTTDSDCAYIRISMIAWYADIPCETVLPDNFQMELGIEETKYVSPQVIDNSLVDLLGHPDADKLGYIKPVSTRNIMTLTFENAGIDLKTGEFVFLTSGKNNAASPDYIKVTGGETYTLSWKKRDTSSYMHVFFYDAKKTYLNNVGYDAISNTALTVTTPEECRYVRILFYWDQTPWQDLLLEDFQMELGARATPYISVQGIETDKINVDELATKMPPPNFNYSAYGLPVLEFEGNISAMNKDNAVTLNYKYGDRAGSCTLKWQGSSSIAHPKKNYTVKFDTAFEAKEGWGEQKKYCLKANYIDFTHSRNICCAKLWGGVVKSRTPANATLNALPNAGAVDGFPICVVINGEYKGVYTFNIPKDGWMFGMGDGTNEAILCADASTIGACSFDALATLDGDFDVEYVPDEDNIDWVRNSVNRLIQACLNSDGTDLDTTIAQYLDWESAIDYYAHCLVTQNYDGLTKNYLLATYDGVKWFFSAYDMDSTFGLWWDGSSFITIFANTVEGVANNHRILRLIKTYKADALKARYKELVHNINGALSEENVVQTFTNFAGSIPKALLDEEVKIWPTLPSTSTNNVSQIIDFNRRRRAYIDPQIEAL